MLCIFIELGFRLSADTVRIPDIAFVSTERAKQIDPDRPIDGALTLVVEVVSPTDLAAELARKVDQYLAAGAQVVWVLYPNVKEVHTCRPGRTSATLAGADVLEAPDLIPRF